MWLVCKAMIIVDVETTDLDERDNCLVSEPKPHNALTGQDWRKNA